MRFALALLFALSLCLPCFGDHCRGGSCGLRKVAAVPVKLLKAKPVRSLLGRIFHR